MPTSTASVGALFKGVEIATAAREAAFAAEYVEKRASQFCVITPTTQLLAFKTRL